MTLLFTDIEGSTRQWEDAPGEMSVALARHDELLHDAVAAVGGFVFKTVGDAFCVAFPSASAAVSGALAAQRLLATESWPDPITMRVRMGLHSGECVERDGDYFGPTVNRAARLEATAHGGQIILSGATRSLLSGELPDGARLRDLGEHRLKDLGLPEHVFQVEVDGLGSEFPPLRSLSNPDLPNNLPRYASSFVGRDAEVVAVRELVANARLVTLTGPGGAGKTRLAVQVAAEFVDGSGDGVWIIDLASVTDEAMVPTTIADTLGVRTAGEGDSIDALLDAVVDRRLLIVLDNCEHLIDATASIADRLIHSGDGINLIATSREPLGISGEVVYRVPSLGLPDASDVDPESIGQAESVCLFTERARLHDPAFTLDVMNAASVAAVCRRLDGIPFALELAAARLRSLSADELLGRLDQRFRLLTGGSRTAMARQQTLRATIDWSFELLDPRERSVLTRASVFAGSWDLDAAEAVTADDADVDAIDVLDILTGLVDKSLVNVETNGTTRFRMLETIREYAAEKQADGGLEASTSLRSKHLAHFLSLAERAAPRIRTGEQRRWLDLLESDHDNLRAALVAASELGEAEAGLRLGRSLRWYAWLRARCRDLVEPLTALVAISEPNQPLTLDALVALAFLELGIDEYARAEATLESAIVILRERGDGTRLADALWVAGWLAIYSDDLARAEALGIEGLTVAESARDTDAAARMHGVVAIGVAARGDLTAARSHFGAELAGYLTTGDVMAQAMSQNNHGDIELQAGEVDIADDSFAAAETIVRELDLPEMLGVVILNRGNIAALRGDHASALTRGVEALSLAHRHGLLRLTASALVGCTRALLPTDTELAATLHGAAEHLLAVRGVELQPLEARLHAENASRLRAALGDDTYEHQCALGGTAHVHDLIALVRSQIPV